MALPKINETLNFSMKIPSTGKTVKYRPYLVKEEKVLLQAFESGDTKTCLEAMVDTLNACIDPKTKVSVDQLATFDVEYMFTQVRSKSVGENSTILVKCKECEKDNPVVVNLEELHIDVSKTDSVIDVTDSISVKMKFPTYGSILEGDVDKLQESDTQTALEMIASSIESVMTEDEVIDCATQDKSEMLEFVSSMTAGQLQGISKFLEDMPALTHEVSFDCEHCAAKNEIELRGLSDFF